MKTERPKYKSVIITVQEKQGVKSIQSKSFTVYDPFEKVLNEVSNLVNRES